MITTAQALGLKLVSKWQTFYERCQVVYCVATAKGSKNLF
jgi:hypothetical protein